MLMRTAMAHLLGESTAKVLCEAIYELIEGERIAAQRHSVLLKPL